MRLQPRPRDLPLLNRAVMVRAYLVLGLVEALVAMTGYLLTWQANGVGWSELRVLAPQLLHHTADASVGAIQQQATTVSFCLIVAAQIGTLLACRSEHRPAWAMLGIPNRLLWLGLLSEPLLASVLVLLAPLAALFGMAPFPLAWLGPMALAPLLVILVDAIDKRWRQAGQVPPRFSRSSAAVPR